jgi:superfamily II DNA or RNA helicase
MYKLEEYQKKFNSNIFSSLLVNRSIIAQLATGGGKTVCFASLTKDWITNTNKDVLILVHRQELLKQTRETIYKWHGILPQAIDANTNQIEQSRVFVAMVETINNRLKNPAFARYLKNVGLLIIDEAHLSNFKKIFVNFADCKRIGFSATPISAIKKDPLINYYEDIICGVSIKELIEYNQNVDRRRGVVQDLTYTIKNVKRDELKTKGDDFDYDQMGTVYSKPKYIQNTIDWYLKLAFGKKMLVFNPNVATSLKLTDEMRKAKIDARHLDGGMSDEERRKTFAWFKATPNAVLNNVGIATTGFDEPSAEGTILNLSTKSLTKYIQCCGRSARPYQYPDETFKTEHIIIDMGDNVIGGGMGEWSDDRDWRFGFFNPKKPGEGVAPKKECPECFCINAASARTCKGKKSHDLDEELLEDCLYEFPIKETREDSTEVELILVTKGIDVSKNIEYFSNRGEFFSLFETIRQVACHIEKNFGVGFIEESVFDEMWSACHIKVKEWCKLKEKKSGGNFYSRDMKQKFIKELQDIGFIIEFKNENE